MSSSFSRAAKRASSEDSWSEGILGVVGELSCQVCSDNRLNSLEVQWDLVLVKNRGLVGEVEEGGS